MHLVEEFALHPFTNWTLFGLDISLNKAVIMIWLAAALVFILLFIAGRKAEMVPKGVQNFVEMIIEFIHEGIVEPMIGKKGTPWVPFLTTVFLFVLFMNLLGLVPGMYTATSRLYVTASLAMIIFITVHAAGVKAHGVSYIKNFVPGGVPAFLAPVLFVIEMIGALAKPFSLAVRLCANMFAGHLVLGAFIGLALLFKSLVIAPLPLMGAVVITGLEIFISGLQAYVFTMLSAMYISDAINSHH